MRKILIFLIIIICFTPLISKAAITYSTSTYYGPPYFGFFNSGNTSLDVLGYLKPLEYDTLLGATAGTATANEALILGASKEIDTIRILEGGSSPTKYTAFVGGDQSADLTLTLPTGYAASSGYVLSSTDAGVLSWVANAGTFTGGNITSDCTLSNGVDLLSSTTTAHTNSLQGRDIDGSAYVDVLRWTNGNTVAVVLGSSTTSLAITSTGLNVTTGGVITGAAGITNTGALTQSGGVVSINASGSNAINIGTGTNTGTLTLGNNSCSVAMASSVWDISSAGAMSGFTTLSLSDDITMATGKGVKSSTTTAHTVGLYGYDVDGTAYVGGIVMTNGDTPATVVGNTNGTTAISSSDWTISTTGVVAGIGAVGMDGALSISNASPTINIKDSDAADGDDNITIVGAATTTTSSHEDVDLTINQQIDGTLRTVVTLDADGNITLGYGTQNVVATADVVVTGSDLSIGTAGVKLTGDGDGAVTFLSLGNGYTEDLKINLDDVENEGTVTSSTGLVTVNFSGIDVRGADIESYTATPSFEFYDSDCGDGDISAKILVAATTTTSAHEDIDVTFTQQSDGSDHNFITADGDGNLTLDSAAGVIVCSDTVTFSGGQTRKVRFDPKVVELDGTAPPTLDDIGTDDQCNISALLFDADGGDTGDDIAYISWLVPDGYVTDSARLNVCYTFSAAEDAADEAQFDFAVNAVAAGETLDAAGTALADQTTVIADASTGNGKLYITQYNIEVEDIVVDDLVTIEIAVDESASALAASGTLDVLYFEIEYESTE